VKANFLLEASRVRVSRKRNVCPALPSRKIRDKIFSNSSKTVKFSVLSGFQNVCIFFFFTILIERYEMSLYTTIFRSTNHRSEIKTLPAQRYESSELSKSDLFSGTRVATMSVVVDIAVFGHRPTTTSAKTSSGFCTQQRALRLLK